MVGQRIGKLTVIQFSHIQRDDKSKRNRKFWKLICECGNTHIAVDYSLKKGTPKSCGCSRYDGCRTHGKSNSKIYSIWEGIIRRCKNPNHKAYKHYGGRGIKVSKEWLIFENFYKDMGDPGEGMTIDRIDNNKGYFKENCRWITQKEQVLNTRRNVFIEFNGKKQTLSEWTKELGFSRSSIRERLALGWSTEEALSIPLKSFRIKSYRKRVKS